MLMYVYYNWKCVNTSVCVCVYTWLLSTSDSTNHIVDAGHLIVAVNVHAHFTERKHVSISISFCEEEEDSCCICDKAISPPHFCAKSSTNPGPMRYDTFRAPFQSGGGEAPPIFLKEMRK